MSSLNIPKPQMPASILEKASADAKAKADAFKKDDDLALAAGNSPEQVEARQKTARLYCEIHLPEEKPADRDARLAGVNYSMPVRNIDGRLVNMNPPKKNGFMGIGAKPTPQYWVSNFLPAKGPDDAIYAFEYFPVKKG